VPIVGERIKMLRAGAGLSQFGLGKVLNVHPATISLWETGNREPDLEMIGKLCEYFNVTSDFILGIEQLDTSDKLPTELGVMFRGVDWNKLSPEDKAILNAVLKSVTEKHRKK